MRQRIDGCFAVRCNVGEASEIQDRVLRGAICAGTTVELTGCCG